MTGLRWESPVLAPVSVLPQPQLYASKKVIFTLLGCHAAQPWMMILALSQSLSFQIFNTYGQEPSHFVPTCCPAEQRPVRISVFLGLLSPQSAPS